LACMMGTFIVFIAPDGVTLTGGTALSSVQSEKL